MQEGDNIKLTVVFDSESAFVMLSGQLADGVATIFVGNLVSVHALQPGLCHIFLYF